jgi:hypothetical protein
MLDAMSRAVANRTMKLGVMQTILMGRSEKNARRASQEAMIRKFIDANIIFTYSNNNYIVEREAYERYKEWADDPVVIRIFRQVICERLIGPAYGMIKQVNGNARVVLFNCKLRHLEELPDGVVPLTAFENL